MIAEQQTAAPATNEMLEWTATEVINHIRCGSVTAEHYASELLKRYRETQAWNAITWINEDRVLESARAVDASRSRGQKLGPLAGLPLGVMDMISTVGFPTTGGTAALQGYYPPRNALVTDILFRNGAILFGKTNMHELGRGVTTSNATFGATGNPYDAARVPGGGAGGTASAIGLRILPAGLATDTAGSARLPAGLCGVVGLRPPAAGPRKTWTLGSWTVLSSHDGIVPIAYSLTEPSPMGRSVADVALLDAIITGASVQKPVSLGGVRIGVPRSPYWEDLDPEVARVCERALEKLRHAGAILIDVNLSQWADATNQTFFTLATMNNLQDLASFLATNVPDVTLAQLKAGVRSKDVQAALQRETENPVPPETAEQAMRMRQTLAVQYEELFQTNNFAAIVCPTVPVLAPLIRPHGDQTGDTIELNGKQVDEFGTLLRNTLLGGVVGIPSLALPSGLSSSALPIGLSFYGLADAGRALLGLGISVEAVLGRLPAPRLHNGSTAQPPVQPTPTIPSAPATPPAISGPGDNVDYILALLKRSAYVNMYATFATSDAALSGTFTATAPLRRYDIDFRIDGCGPGIRAVDSLGEECSRVHLRWTFTPNGAARNFSIDDLFVLDDGGNQFRGQGSGRIARSPLPDGGFTVNANGNIVQGTGIFAGVQGSYVLTGSERSRLDLYFFVRLMDPSGAYQTASELRTLEERKRDDRSVTSLALLGEPDPENPVQLTPTGAIVHELLRAVHTDFDTGSRNNGLRSSVMLGPIVAHWQTDVLFNPADPSAPGTPDRPLQVRLQNIKITFLNGTTETIKGSIENGRGYIMKLPGVSGPQFRMTGFGSIDSGTGLFSNVQGGIFLLGAIDLVPAAFSNYYVLQLADPGGRFRC